MDNLIPIGRKWSFSPGRVFMRVIVVTAVAVEKDAVLRGLRFNPRFDVLIAGVGSVAAAINTIRALAAAEYGLVISAGIGGGFIGQAEVGSLVVADEIVAADMGAETAEGFSSLEELGFGFTSIRPQVNLVEQVAQAFQAVNLPVKTGPVLTVATVTGTAATAGKLSARVPGAAAEAMEGFGVGCAALNYGLPVLEIRAISNPVGPRERSSWRIPEALDILQRASSVLAEVFP